MKNRPLNIRQVQSTVHNFVSLLKEKIPVKEVYLYGSYAKNKPKKGSDIDICVISDKFKDSFSFNLYLNKMVMKMDDQHKSYLSPVGFNSKTFYQMIIPLTYEIHQTGKKIKT